MQHSLDFESERDTTETSQPRPVWPSGTLAGHLVSNRSKFGFEVTLRPFTTERSLEVEGSPGPVSFSQQLSTGPLESRQPEESLASGIDFESLERLFSKVNAFDGRLTLSKRFGELPNGSSLTKRPPTLGRRRKLEVETGDSSTIHSSYSMLFDDRSESQDASFNKSGHLGREKESRPKGRARDNSTKITLPPPSGMGILARSERIQRKNVKERQVKTYPKEDDELKAFSEQAFIEFIKQLILNDEFSSDEYKKLPDIEKEIILKIIRCRYKDAENWKFPFKAKSLAACNTKNSLRFVNEKKLIGDIWPLIIDLLKKLKSLWKADKEQETILLFRTYHKPYFKDEIRHKVDASLAEQIDQGNDVLLGNLFAEFYLGYRP